MIGRRKTRVSCFGRSAGGKGGWEGDVGTNMGKCIVDLMDKLLNRVQWLCYDYRQKHTTGFWMGRGPEHGKMFGTVINS